MELGGSMPHSQGLSNNPYPEHIIKKVLYDYFVEFYVSECIKTTSLSYHSQEQVMLIKNNMIMRCIL